MQAKSARKKVQSLRIIIVGCGKVGHTLTEQLVREGHDITIVDTRASAWCATRRMCST